MKKTWAQKAVDDLERLGWSLTGIAKATGLSIGSVSDLKQRRSKEPTGMGAIKLNDLHKAGKAPDAEAA